MAELNRSGEKKIQEFLEDEVGPLIRDEWIGNLTASQQVLSEDIRVFSDSDTVKVGSRNEILKFLEWGVEPHVIEPDQAEALAWETDQGETVFATRVEHPGFEAFAHMRNALSETWLRFQRSL